MVTATRVSDETDTTYLQLRDLIINAELMPNSRHNEADVARRLVLKPHGIRSATRRLETDGLVISNGPGAFTIAPLTIERVRSLYRQVSILESRAAYIASVMGPTPIAFSALRDAVLAMDDALYRGDNLRWARAAHHFNRSLVLCSNRPRMINAVLPLAQPMHQARMVSVRLDPPPTDSVKAHMQLLAFMRSGEPEAAYDLWQSYWQRCTESFLQLLKAHNLHGLNSQLPTTIA